MHVVFCAAAASAVLPIAMGVASFARFFDQEIQNALRQLPEAQLYRNLPGAGAQLAFHLRVAFAN